MWQHSLWVHSGPAHILEASGSCAIRPSVRSRGGQGGWGGGVAAAVCRHRRRLWFRVYVHTYSLARVAGLGAVGNTPTTTLQRLWRPPDLTEGRCVLSTCITLVRLACLSHAHGGDLNGSSHFCLPQEMF